MASANNNHASIPFWDSVHPAATNRATDPGTGVDHIQPSPQFPAGFPFHEAGPWGMWRGPGGHRGRRGGWGGPWGGRFRGWYDNSNDMAHEGGDDDGEDGPDTPGTSPPPPPHHGGEHPPPPPCPPGAGHPFPHHRGFGRRCGRGRGGPCGRGGSRHHGPPPPYQGAWDFRPMMHAFAQHPLAQALRHYFEQEQAEDEAFTPPVDVFNRPSEWQLHVALPGAKKEDVGVSWDSDKKMLEIAGVIYRPGDEEFLQSLSMGERKVGMFSRTVKLPPEGSDEKDEVDGDSISAKIEDGILIVTVPKVEREWTEIKKVDIQ